MIVTAANVMLARYVAGQLGPSSQNMFIAPLEPAAGSTSGPTHYVSAGMVGREFADMLASPEALVAGAASIGVDLDPAVANLLLSTSDVSAQTGSEALERLGLVYSR